MLKIHPDTKITSEYPNGANIRCSPSVYMIKPVLCRGSHQTMLGMVFDNMKFSTETSGQNNTLTTKL